MDFRLPELGEGVYEAELVAWKVKVGDVVRRGQILMEVLTDKASMEVPAPFAGTITDSKVEPGQNIKVGEIVLVYKPARSPDGQATTEDGSQRAEKSPAEKKAEPAAADSTPGKRLTRFPVPPTPSPVAVKAAPSVRYLARKLGADLSKVHGSGPGGRILIGDLASLVKPAEAASQQEVPEDQADYGKPGSRIKLQGLRRKIAEHMVLAKKTIPHYSYVDECDVSDLVRLRDALRETYAKAGIKLTYLAFFVKAVTAALKEIPIVNSTLDEKAEEIILHDQYNVGIAVSTSGGLIVPVIHDADQKDLAQLAQDIERLSTEARAGKAKLADLRGGTFTITSVGNVGGLFSTPVINHPEVAILGIGKVVKRPVLDAHGNVRAADVLYLSFSFDHRVVDGAIGAAFSNAIVRRLQNPAALLLPNNLLNR
jgi:pyruvate dehydrogenase E2 component (dihydrolipoamide acetyltransferase)/2-oxoisovalerate dehydrogenase E2 component (dihydrolipoyl transacylase)